MAQIDNQTLRTIQEKFREYEQEILLSRYSTNSKSQRVGYARRFVEWLAGTYSPDDYDGSRT